MDLPLFSAELLLLLLLVTVAANTAAVAAAAEENNNQQQPNCNIPLTTNNYDSCNIAFCLGQQSKHEDSFVCDISAFWMHHVGGGEEDDGNDGKHDDDWYPATPPKGTGIHEYVAYTGEPPCTQNGHCPGCDPTILVETNNIIRLCSIFIDPTDCSVKCPSHSKVVAAADSSSSSGSQSEVAAAATTTVQDSSSSGSGSGGGSWILVAIAMTMAVSVISYFFRRKRALQDFVKVENLTELASLNKGS